MWLTREQRDRIMVTAEDGYGTVDICDAWDAAPADAEQTLAPFVRGRSFYVREALRALGYPHTEQA